MAEAMMHETTPFGAQIQSIINAQLVKLDENEEVSKKILKKKLQKIYSIVQQWIEAQHASAQDATANNTVSNIEATLKDFVQTQKQMQESLAQSQKQMHQNTIKRIDKFEQTRQ